MDRSSPEQPGSDADSSLMEHLLELRTRLMRALAGLALALLALLPFANRLYAWLAAPLLHAQRVEAAGGVPAHPAVRQAEEDQHPVAPSAGEAGYACFEPWAYARRQQAAPGFGKPVGARNAVMRGGQAPAAILLPVGAFGREHVDEEGVDVRPERRGGGRGDAAHPLRRAGHGAAIMGDAIAVRAEGVLPVGRGRGRGLVRGGGAGHGGRWRRGGKRKGQCGGDPSPHHGISSFLRALGDGS